MHGQPALFLLVLQEALPLFMLRRLVRGLFQTVRTKECFKPAFLRRFVCSGPRGLSYKSNFAGSSSRARTRLVGFDARKRDVGPAGEAFRDKPSTAYELRDAPRAHPEHSCRLGSRYRRGTEAHAIVAGEYVNNLAIFGVGQGASHRDRRPSFLQRSKVRLDAIR